MEGNLDVRFFLLDHGFISRNDDKHFVRMDNDTH